MADKRIIEHTATTTLYNDDYFLVDRATTGNDGGTRKIVNTRLKQLFGGNNFAGEWQSGTTYTKDSYVTHEGKLYHNIKGGSVVSVNWNSSQWQEIDVSSELKKVVGSLAPPFDSSTNYDVDDLVTFNGGLCRCISPHSAGAWNSSHFATVKVSSLLTYFIMDNFTDKQWEKYSGSPVNYTKGTVIHKGLSMYRCKANTTNQSWDSSKWEQVDVTDLLATEHGYIQSLFSIIAPTFSTSTSYNVDDFVIYNNQLYICVKPHRGSWYAPDFYSINIGDAIKSSYNNFAEVYNFTGNYVKGDIVSYSGVLLRCMVDNATTPFDYYEWEQVTVEQLIDEKVADVQIAGQTTVDENHISDLTSLAIEGTASGEIATFNDGSNLPMRSFICNISAVQDLHGYDAPWVGGAGKNLFFTNLTVGTFPKNGLTFTVQEDGQIKVSGTATANTYQSIGYFMPKNNVSYILNGCPSNGSTSTYRMTLLTVGYDTGDGLRFTGGSSQLSISIDVYSGQTVNLTFKPMIRLATETDATFAPYSNICPISGHTGVDAWVRGKNLFCTDVTAVNKTTEYRKYSSQRANLTKISDNSFRATGNNGQWTSGYYEIDGINGTLDYAISYTIKDNNTSYTPTLKKDPHSDESKLVLFITFNNNSTLTTSEGATFDNVQVELGETASTYEPYNPNSQTISVSWQTEAGEVFGGYVDLVSGVLTVDKMSITFNGTENWSYSATNNRVYRYISSNAKAPSGTDKGFIQSDKLHYSGDEIEEYGAFISSSKNLVVYAPSSITSGEQWATWLTSNNIQVVYELATPQTYQLTPMQIKSLLGNNNAWCSTGDVNVKYNKDATTVINSLIARIEALENA